jgi:hypothetical protein
MIFWVGGFGWIVKRDKGAPRNIYNCNIEVWATLGVQSGSFQTERTLEFLVGLPCDDLNDLVYCYPWYPLGHTLWWQQLAVTPGRTAQGQR